MCSVRAHMIAASAMASRPVSSLWPMTWLGLGLGLGSGSGPGLGLGLGLGLG